MKAAETRLSRAFHGRRKPLRFAAVQTDFAEKRHIACCWRDKDGKRESVDGQAAHTFA